MNSHVSWDLEEFDRHSAKLDAIAESVAETATKGKNLGGGGFLLYGILPNPFISPVMSLTGHALGSMLDQLTNAIIEASEGIKETRRANNEAEMNGIDRSQEVGRILGEISEGLR